MTAAVIEPIGTGLQGADLAPPEGAELLVDVKVQARVVITSF